MVDYFKEKTNYKYNLDATRKIYVLKPEFFGNLMNGDKLIRENY